jgi:hypothetical protein
MRILAICGMMFLLSCSISNPNMTDVTPSGPPAPNEAKVIFYRTDVTGNAATFPVYADHELVGYPERGRYFEVYCEPGEHVFSSPAQTLFSRPDVVVLATLEPGKSYFIQAYVSGGGCGELYPRFKPLTRGDSHWAKIDKKILKLQCRALAIQGGTETEAHQHRLIKKQESKEPPSPGDEPRLQPEDGR